MDIQESPLFPPTKAAAPLSFKIFATILLLFGLGMLFEAFVLFLLNPLLSSIPFVLFLFNEKTAIDLFKLKRTSLRNFYITVILNALFISFKLPLLTKSVSSRSLLFAFTISLLIAFLLIIPFLIVTRNKLPSPSTNPTRDNRIIIMLVIAIFIIGGVYLGIQNRQQKKAIDEVFDTFETQTEESEKSTYTLRPSKRKASERCAKLLNPEFIGKTCALKTPVFSHLPYNSDNYCNLVTKKGDEPDFGLWKGMTPVAELVYELPASDYSNYRKNLSADVKIIENIEIKGESYITTNAKNYNVFVFRPTSKKSSMRLSSRECSVDALKIIGREVINNLY